MSTITTINAGDGISPSRTVLNANFAALNADKVETSVLDTDTTLAANSDAKVATQKAVKAYVDGVGVANATTTARGLVEIATQAQVNAGTAIGETGASLVVTPETLAGAVPIVRTYLNAGSPHTWTKPSGIKYVVVEAVGGGGGGAGANEATPDRDGCGGGAGGYSKKTILASSLGSTETVTVGAGGTAGPSGTGTGGTGGTTSFGSHVTCTGGTGGAIGDDKANRGVGGTASGGDINVTGNVGQASRFDSGVSNGQEGGDGADSPFGKGGLGNSTGVGGSPSGYGSGGAGSHANGSDQVGVAGAGGVVYVTEYYV